MDGLHDATDMDDTHTSSDPPAPEISVPHNFFINFSPELKTWLLQVLDGDDDDNFHMILNFFDSKLYESCKKACSSNWFLPERICGDQWLRSEIILDKKDLSSSESRTHNIVHIRSNILPLQASLKKLLTSVAKSSRAKSLGMPLRILTNIAGRVHKTLAFDAIEDGDPRGTCTLAEGSKTDLQKICKADVRLPVVSHPELWIGLDKILYEGRTVEVWKVIISQGVFAMKKFKEKEHLRTEAAIVQVLSHPHIVHTFASTGLDDPNAGIDQLSLLMECMEDDLSSWISSNTKLRPLDLLDILLQVAQAMEYLHGERVVHGDLKPQNILISQFDISEDAGKFIVGKVADFGNAQKANSARFSCNQGTTRWTPPEVLQCRVPEDSYLEHPFKVDVYSFGLIAYEVLTGLVIFDKAPTLKELTKQIMANDFSQYFTSFDDKKDKYPESFISFMKRCWAFKPTERPSFHEIIKKIKEARSSLITRSSETPVSTGCLPGMKSLMKKVTPLRSTNTKALKSCNRRHPTPPISSSVHSSIAKDKTEINEKDMDVKKGSVTTTSLENPNQRPETKPLKSKFSVLVSRKVIAKTTKVKKGLKELGKKGCKVVKELLEPKNTAKEVPPPPTQPSSSSGAPVESMAQEDKGTKRKPEGEACEDDSEQGMKSKKKSKP